MGKKGMTSGLPKKSQSFGQGNDQRGGNKPSGQGIDISDIGKYITLEDDSHISVETISIPKEFIGCASIVNNTSDQCFLTSFEREDIQFFLEILGKPLFKETKKYEEKRAVIENSIWTWKKKKGQNIHNPVEPLLYALKLTDNVIGSAKTAADPDPELLCAFAKGMAPCWDETFEPDNDSIRHILVNWDWYQPILVILCMYQQKTGYDDPKIDEIIRKKKLFTPDYATVSFECLANHPTDENIECLLKFISQQRYAAIVTKAEIMVTKKQKDCFQNMYRKLSRDRQDEVRSIYVAKFRTNAYRKSRVFLDRLMGIKEDDEMRAAYEAYCIASGEEKQKYLEKLERCMDLTKDKNVWIVREFQDKAIMGMIDGKLQNANNHTYGSIIWNLAQNNYDEAQKYLVSEWNRMSDSDQRWLGCACAHNLLHNTPSMDEIVRAFFLEGKDYHYTFKHQLHWLIKRQEKTKEFRESLKDILAEISDSPEKWNDFLTACSNLFYGEYVTYLYPKEIDKLLEKAVAYSAERSDRQMIHVINLVIENLIDRQNRDRYVDMLHTIHYTEKFSHGERKRAAKPLYRVYGGNI